MLAQRKGVSVIITIVLVLIIVLGVAGFASARRASVENETDKLRPTPLETMARLQCLDNCQIDCEPTLEKCENNPPLCNVKYAGKDEKCDGVTIATVNCNGFVVTKIDDLGCDS